MLVILAQIRECWWRLKDLGKFKIHISIKPIDGLNEVERKARSKEDEKIQNKFQVFNKKLGRLWCYLPQ